MRKRNLKRKTLKDIYKTYPHFAKKDKYYCTKNDFTNICKMFNVLISEQILETGKSFNTPYGLGKIRIKKFKPNGKKLDYGLSKKLGKQIFHKNLHSQGLMGKFYWDKYRSPKHFTHRVLYVFRPTRTNKQSLTNCLVEKNYITRYFE